MDAIKVLKKDHDEVKQLFKEFEEAGERAHKKKQTIAMEIIKELMAHSQVEERFFYARLLEKGDKELKKLVLEGIEEHRGVDFMIERVKSTEPEDPTFDAKVKVLIEMVEHHVKEEEKEMFPMARETLGEELEPIGQQIEQMHKQLEGEGG